MTYTQIGIAVVIAAIGNNGSQPANGAMLTVCTAQLSMNDVAGFKCNVKAFRTDVLVDKEAEKLFPGWQDHVEQWKKVGSDRPYHYLGSADRAACERAGTRFWSQH